MTATDKLKLVKEGKMAKREFVRQMRQAFPQFITQFNGFDDSVQILKNKGMIFEAKEEPYTSVATPNPRDKFPINDIERGIRYELEAAGIGHGEVPSEEEYKKAEEKALANLNKDANHYLNLVSGESKNVDKHDQMTAVKSNNHVDTHNQMKKADLREDFRNRRDGSRVPDAPEGSASSDPKEGLKDAARYLMSHYNLGKDEIKDFFDHTPHEEIVGKTYAEIEEEYHLYLGANPHAAVHEEETCSSCGAPASQCKCDGHVHEKKADKDYDGDGEVESGKDEYMGAKDKAIKKAMGKDENVAAALAATRGARGALSRRDGDDKLPDLERSEFGEKLGQKLDDFIERLKAKRAARKNEALKEGVTKLVQKILTEAHTQGLQKYIDGEGDAEIAGAAKELMEVIEALEKEFLKHKTKIEQVFEKVGPYMSPALEKAFKMDLSSQRQSFENLDTPKTPKLTPDQLAQIQQAKAAGSLGELDIETDDKKTVFTPNL